METRWSRIIVSAGGAAVSLGWGIAPATAQTAGNAAFQDFLTSACANATGQLALLCAQSNGGNLSTDSESSLNPNQTAVASRSALARAQALADETEKQLQELRSEDEGTQGTTGGKVAGFGPWSIFGNLEAEWFDQDRPAFANERAFDGDGQRGTLGVDYRLSPGSHLGLMVSYGETSATFAADPAGRSFIPQDDAGGTRTEQFSIASFASFVLSDNVWLDASAGIGFTDHDFRRQAQFQESTRTLPQVNLQARGSAKGRDYFVSAGAGYDLASGPWTLGAYARGLYSRSTVRRYTEVDAGTGLALNVDPPAATSLTGTVGARGSYAISTGWGVVVPQARAEYEHEFEDDPRLTRTSFVLDPANTQFAVAHDRPDRDFFNAGIGVAFVLPNGISPFVDYEALLGYSDFTRHRVTAGLRLEL